MKFAIFLPFTLQFCLEKSLVYVSPTKEGQGIANRDLALIKLGNLTLGDSKAQKLN
jgi:hypothetical protein